MMVIEQFNLTEEEVQMLRKDSLVELFKAEIDCLENDNRDLIWERNFWFAVTVVELILLAISIFKWGF